MKAILIQITDAPTPDVVHRFRNFGEDLYRELGSRCLVSIQEIDKSTTSFALRDIRTRDLGAITKSIKAHLRKHHFDGTGTISPL